MISILKKRRKKIECLECGCKFSFNEKDVKFITIPSPLKARKKYIVCPQCEEETMLSEAL